MKIGIIGFGNLGRALASGLIKSGYDAGNIFVCDNSEQALTLAAGDFRMHASDDVNTTIGASEVIFLTVKSYVFEKLAEKIDRQRLGEKTIVSFMAGVPLERLRALIGDVELIRAMPSLAIAVCDGVIGYTKAPPRIAGLFGKLGYAFETDPADIERVMAFSSCGLGFAAYLIDAFASAGETMGFSKETSVKIAALTFKNAVQRGSFKETVTAVATPGGATEQGITHMDESCVYDIISAAVAKAYKKMNEGS